MLEKSSFYRSAGGAFVAEIEESAAKRSYNGVERRRSNRRTMEDRRVDIRFDLKGDRREQQGRREADKAPRFW
tara:strand:+ start:5866 stop:6084 length:219 start_codon:yes stop_codon:yes gene_type:complete